MIFFVKRNDCRISKLEMLDEIEELDLVLQHYAITWGIKLPSAVDDSKLKAKWLEWGIKPSVEAIGAETDNEN
jgi:[phosphatase 2A protein]-leucine-carboxy methyltransferase